MKQMIVVREGACPEPQEVDAYLYNTEVTRQDVIDMVPDQEDRRMVGTLGVYASTWEIVFKDSEKFDFWHLSGEGTRVFAFDEEPIKAVVGLLEPYRGPHCILHTVVHKHNAVLLIYRIKKRLSDLLAEHLPQLVDSFKDGHYHYVIPDAALGPLSVSLTKEEDAANAKNKPANHPTA